MDSKALAAQIAEQDAKRVNSTDAMNEALAQYGVPEIRKNVAAMRTTVANTNNALKAVDPSVTGRTQNSLVTEAQRAKIVNNERAPIADQLTEQTGALGTMTADANEAEMLATMLAQNRVADWERGRQALQSRYDMTYKAEQDTLAKQLAEEERRRAQADSDRNYQLKVRELAASQANAGSRAAADAGKGYGVKQLSSGNYAFNGPNGAPVSMYQYAQATGASMLDILKNSGSKYDKQAYQDAVYWLQKGCEDLAISNLRKKYGKLF